MKTKELILKILQLLDDSLDDNNLDLEKFKPEVLEVSKERFYYVLEMMQDVRLIKNVTFTTGGMNRTALLANINNMKITLNGIMYLDDNTTTAKIIKAAKLLKDTIPML